MLCAGSPGMTGTTASSTPSAQKARQFLGAGGRGSRYVCTTVSPPSKLHAHSCTSSAFKVATTRVELSRWMVKRENQRLGEDGRLLDEDDPDELARARRPLGAQPLGTEVGEHRQHRVGRQPLVALVDDLRGLGDLDAHVLGVERLERRGRPLLHLRAVAEVDDECAGDQARQHRLDLQRELAEALARRDPLEGVAEHEDEETQREAERCLGVDGEEGRSDAQRHLPPHAEGERDEGVEHEAEQDPQHDRDEEREQHRREDQHHPHGVGALAVAGSA